jgi:hypothetical protein
MPGSYIRFHHDIFPLTHSTPLSQDKLVYVFRLEGIQSVALSFPWAPSVRVYVGYRYTFIESLVLLHHFAAEQRKTTRQIEQGKCRIKAQPSTTN